MNSVNSSVSSPVKHKKDKVKDKIIKLVLPKIQGSVNAMTSDLIADTISVKRLSTNVIIRRAMKELLIDENIPIIAGSKGFFVATELSEIDNYVDSTERRIRSMQRNINALELLKKKTRK